MTYKNVHRWRISKTGNKYHPWIVSHGIVDVFGFRTWQEAISSLCGYLKSCERA